MSEFWQSEMGRRSSLPGDNASLTSRDSSQIEETTRPTILAGDKSRRLVCLQLDKGCKPSFSDSDLSGSNVSSSPVHLAFPPVPFEPELMAFVAHGTDTELPAA